MITAAADGSSLSNPGPAGWAWYIDEGRWAAGGWKVGTNNMGELMAVINLLQQTQASDEPLTVLCDSQYVANTATKWIAGWKRRGWRKADGNPVLNLELVRQLDAELAGRQVRFQWVKGHAGHYLNERADTLARAAATAFRDGRPVEAGPGFADPAAPRESLPVAPTPRPQPEPDLFSADPAPGGRTGLWPAPETSTEQTVVALQTALLDEATLLDRERLSQLLHRDYAGFEADGQIRTRGSLLARATALPGTATLQVIGFSQLGDALVQLRYRVRRQGEERLCSSLWQRDRDGWRIRFQQETPA